MSNYKWCHGPKCHKSHTQDRIRGVKGSKVLRTRKIKLTKWNRNHYFRFFCTQGCYNDFANTHIERIIALAPRNMPLETPIDVVKEVRRNGWDNSDYTAINITERGVDTNAE